MNYGELITLLKKAENIEIIDERKEEIAQLIPQVKKMFYFNLHSPAHQYDLWIHSLHVVVGLPKNIEDDMLYLAGLLHDIGKVKYQSKDTLDEGVDIPSYEHPYISVRMVRDEILPELKSKGAEISIEDEKTLIYYVKHHDEQMSLKKKSMRRHLNEVTLEVFMRLLIFQIADAKAHVQLPFVLERIEVCRKLLGDYGKKIYEQIFLEK